MAAVWLLWCGGDAVCAKFLSLFCELCLKLVDLMKLLCFDLGWLNGLKVCGDAVDQRLHVCNGLVLFRWHWLSGLFVESLCQIVDEQVLLSHVLEEHGHQHAFSYIPRGNESHVTTRAE